MHFSKLKFESKVATLVPSPVLWRPVFPLVGLVRKVQIYMSCLVAACPQPGVPLSGFTQFGAHPAPHMAIQSDL